MINAQLTKTATNDLFKDFSSKRIESVSEWNRKYSALETRFHESPD
jgi:hypothetical protein